MISPRLFRLALSALAASTLAVGGSALAAAGRLKTAVFAGGCFWSAQHDIKPTPGVVRTEVGYAGGTVAHPTYEQVSTETTGHLEAVRVTYDPAKISYAQLVDRYFRTIDPTDADGQFCDHGSSYRTAIFAASSAEKRAAEASKAQLNRDRFHGRVVTQVRDAATFWPAEGYHQDYAARNPVRYGLYRSGCGKDAQLKAVWGR